MGLYAVLNVKYIWSAVKYLKIRIHRLITTRYAVKTAVFAVISIQLIWFTYLKISRDWCFKGHQHCCEQKTPEFDPNVLTFFSRNGSDVSAGTQTEYKDYLINPSSLCANRDVFLVIFVTSAPDHFEIRNGIRYTWGLHARDDDVIVRMVFVIGRTSDSKVQERIRRESIIKSDIIQASFVDSYRNLTLKTMSILYWVSHHCDEARYTMKADDDVFVHIPNLVAVLQRFNEKPRIILGTVIASGSPHRESSSKWHVDYNMYPFSSYPSFVNGPAYVLSHDLVAVLLRRSTSLRLLWLEDVFITGICAQGADVVFIGNCGFGIEKKAAEDWILSSREVTGHQYSLQDMRSLWNKLHNWGIYSHILRFLAILVGS
ncbi:beta-1,3-galactosyltransferase 1-like [Gigantopelta aegis]|uniref:beta-1,3-galactosyltransferase 1-like n=1 Tax=Gigantopelta aegis TaxID=1735272 RepID=UPI001B88896D|nr:beta-1,3-galactosyltransferase 1-like [Gigantopelta aegis]